jgi:hypothetical protein
MDQLRPAWQLPPISFDLPPKFEARDSKECGELISEWILMIALLWKQDPPVAGQCIRVSTHCEIANTAIPPTMVTSRFFPNQPMMAVRMAPTK